MKYSAGSLRLLEPVGISARLRDISLPASAQPKFANRRLHEVSPEGAGHAANPGNLITINKTHIASIRKAHLVQMENGRISRAFPNGIGARSVADGRLDLINLSSCLIDAVVRAEQSGWRHMDSNWDSGRGEE